MFAIAICIGSLLNPLDDRTTALWLVYFSFRQMNLAFSLHGIHPLLYFHDAGVVLCYLIALQLNSGIILAALASSVLLGGWNRISRKMLSFSPR